MHSAVTTVERVKLKSDEESLKLKVSFLALFSKIVL